MTPAGRVVKPRSMSDERTGGRTDIANRGRRRRWEAIYIVITAISGLRPHTLPIWRLYDAMGTIFRWLDSKFNASHFDNAVKSDV